MEQIPDAARHLLEGANIASVATIMPDGSPQVSPVWIDADGDTVLFNTAEGRIKERNIARDPRVAIAVVNSENPYESLLVRGHAEITTDGAEEQIDRLAKRYMGVDEYPLRQPDEVRLIVRIAPESVSHMAPG